MTRSMQRIAFGFPFLVLGLLIISGCGGKGGGITVSGTVTLQGKPVEGVAVMLSPETGRPITGSTDASGKFTLQAPAGSYKVAISKTKTRVPPGVDPEANPDAVTIEYLTPQKYASPMTSGLTLEVKPGMETVTWDLMP